MAADLRLIGPRPWKTFTADAPAETFLLPYHKIVYWWYNPTTIEGLDTLSFSSIIFVWIVHYDLLLALKHLISMLFHTRCTCGPTYPANLRFNYELFNYNNLNICYLSWNYCGYWQKLALIHTSSESIAWRSKNTTLGLGNHNFTGLMVYILLDCEYVVKSFITCCTYLIYLNS